MKITNAVFCDDSQIGVTAETVWQYDYGDELRIFGLKLQPAVEIHFSLTEKGGESVPRVGVTKDNTTIVTIPDTMLENGDTSVDYNVYAWIYLADSESGHTEYKIRIPVCARAKPAPHDTPAEAELFQKAIDAVNESANRAEAAGAAARSWAVGGTGTRESEDTDNAKYYAQQAAESAGTASEKEHAVSDAETAVSKLHEEVVQLSSETSKNAENAAQSATAAGNSAAVARASEQAAIEAAGRAARSESAAAESEKTATAAATAAEKSASTASSAQQRSETAQAAAEKSASAAAASESNASTLETAAAQSAKAAAESEKAAGASAAAASASEQAATAAAQQTSEDRQATETASAAAQQSATAAVEAQQTIQASAEQIETNKTGIESLKEEKADKTALALTDRRLDALWKLSEGISYQFETDEAAAYQKNIPPGAKMTNVKSIGGKTIVWNQLANNSDPVGLNGNVTVDGDVITLTLNNIAQYYEIRFEVKNKKSTRIVNHMYYVSADVKSDAWATKEKTVFITHDGLWLGSWVSKIDTSSADWQTQKGIYKNAKDSSGNSCVIAIRKYYEESMAPFSVRNVVCYDLTKMFGAGNEPSTVEEFEAMFPDDWYPYNEGELMSASVNEVVGQGKNLFDESSYKFEEGAYISYTDGIVGNGTNTCACKNYIELNSAKVINVSSKETSDGRIAFYDSGKTFISGSNTLNNVTVPHKAKYMRFSFTTSQVSNVQIEKSSVATAYSPYHENTYLIPQAILDLPDYGWSAGSVYNYVDFEEKKYHKKIEKVDLGSLKFFQYDPKNMTKHSWYAKIPKMSASSAKLMCSKYEAQSSWIGIGDSFFVQGIIQSHSALNFIYINDDNYENVSDFFNAMQGVILYYELAEEEIIDISDILTDDLTAAWVEGGGTLTFKNANGDGFQLPVPNEVEYAVKLSEVVSND